MQRPHTQTQNKRKRKDIAVFVRLEENKVYLGKGKDSRKQPVKGRPVARIYTHLQITNYYLHMYTCYDTLKRRHYIIHSLLR